MLDLYGDLKYETEDYLTYWLPRTANEINHCDQLTEMLDDWGWGEILEHFRPLDETRDRRDGRGTEELDHYTGWEKVCDGMIEACLWAWAMRGNAKSLAFYVTDRGNVLWQLDKEGELDERNPRVAQTIRRKVTQVG